MTLVPMKEYIFFLAQLLSLVYVAVYTPVLYSRYRSHQPHEIDWQKM